MKAMILETYGPDSTFVAAELDMPTVGAGEVLVKVAATSVNTVDTMIRQLGQEQLPLSPDLPAILGMDFAGTVEAVGDGVIGFRCCQSNANPSPASRGIGALIQLEVGAIRRVRRFSSI